MHPNIVAIITDLAKCEAQRYSPKLGDITNDDDKIQITITNNVPVLTKKSGDPAFWGFRENAVFQFFQRVCVFASRHSVLLNGSYTAGLHDSYIDNLGILVLARNAESHNCMLPDIPSMNGHKLYKDDIPFEKKRDKAIFVGCTTGVSDPAKNQRLQLCNWALSVNDVDAYINAIVQMQPIDVVRVYPNCVKFITNFMNVHAQLEYKHVINVDGNTSSWERLPWILNSNSLCIKNKSPEMCWFYPLLRNGTQYCEYNDFSDILDIMRMNDFEKRQIILNANVFADVYLHDPDVPLLYTTVLLANISGII